MNKVTGPLMIDLQGLSLTAEEIDLLGHPLVGGIILFARNYQSPSQLSELVHQIRNTKNLLIAVDQEGGRVQRFREGFTRLPPMSVFGEIYDNDPARSQKLAYQAGWLMAAELLAFEIDFSFAPVLDLNLGLSEVIGNRSFHKSPQIVITLVEAFSQGVKEAGMCRVGKHFPGHGSVVPDSHFALPIDERELFEIKNSDFVPFSYFASRMEGIMPAHIIFNKIDSNPVGFSRYWLQEVLRAELQFKGAIFSDDLSMQGAAIMGDFIARSYAALEAGCDMILLCNNRQETIKVLDSLKVKFNPESQQRLTNMRGRFQNSYSTLQQLSQWRDASNSIEEITHENTS